MGSAYGIKEYMNHIAKPSENASAAISLKRQYSLMFINTLN